MKVVRLSQTDLASAAIVMVRLARGQGRESYRKAVRFVQTSAGDIEAVIAFCDDDEDPNQPLPLEGCAPISTQEVFDDEDW